MHVVLLTGFAALVAACAGCASRPVNERIVAVDPTQGYRVEVRLPKRPGNDPRTILVLAFSGGGNVASRPNPDGRASG